jgi:hypothetical protein
MTSLEKHELEIKQTRKRIENATGFAKRDLEKYLKKLKKELDYYLALNKGDDI